VRRTRARRNDDLSRTHTLDFLHRDLIVSAHLDFLAQFADVLDQVVGERIVVVEYKNQNRGPPTSDFVLQLNTLRGARQRVRIARQNVPPGTQRWY